MSWGAVIVGVVLTIVTWALAYELKGVL
jgi:hypothetical protein